MKETQNSALTESTYYILLALADQPRHGYAILREVESLSDGRITLSTGTLYGAIKRLLTAGWIARAEDPSEAPARERQPYALTDEGRRVAGAEAERLAELARVSRVRLGQAVR